MNTWNCMHSASAADRVQSPFIQLTLIFICIWNCGNMSLLEASNIGCGEWFVSPSSPSPSASSSPRRNKCNGCCWLIHSHSDDSSIRLSFNKRCAVNHPTHTQVHHMQMQKQLLFHTANALLIKSVIICITVSVSVWVWARECTPSCNPSENGILNGGKLDCTITSAQN